MKTSPELDAAIVREAFNPKVGDRVYRLGTTLNLETYRDGRCVPLAHGLLGKPNAPYNGEFGPDGKIANRLAYSQMAFPIFYAKLNPGYAKLVGPHGASCVEEKYRSRFSHLSVYVETTKASFDKRKRELAALDHAIDSDRHGGRFPRCAIYLRAKDHVITDIDVVVHLDGNKPLDVYDTPQFACYARAAQAGLGLMGLLSAPDDVVVPKGAEKQFRPNGDLHGPYWPDTSRYFLSAPLTPGMTKDEAMAAIHADPEYALAMQRLSQRQAR